MRQGWTGGEEREGGYAKQEYITVTTLPLLRLPQSCRLRRSLSRILTLHWHELH